MIVKTIEKETANEAISLEEEINGVSFSKEEDNNHISFGLFNENLIGVIDYSIVLDTAEILYFCVSELERGKGYSKVLLNKSLEFLKEKNIKEIYLEVSSNNFIAYNLYKKLGFIEFSRRKEYYKDYSDAINMKKAI